MRLLMLFILCGAALAEPSIVNTMTDSADNVVRYTSDAISPTANTTITAGVRLPAEDVAPDLFDAFGRCQYRLIANVMVRSAPRWTTLLVVKLVARRRLLDLIDATTTKIIALERWQADHVATLNRSNELTAANGDLAALINILNGP